jgi:Cu+-exporting ATPase
VESAIRPWRLGLGCALTGPLLALEVIEQFVGDAPISHTLGTAGYVTLQAALGTPVALVCGWPVLRRGWRSLRRGISVATLIALSVFIGFLFSLVVVGYAWLDPSFLRLTAPTLENVPTGVANTVEALAPASAGIRPFFDVAAVIVVIALLGQLLEQQARARTDTAIRALVRLAPKTVRVVRPDGGDEERLLDHVLPGDLVRVGPGEVIPIDGVVREGTSNVDEAILTGETAPADKGTGSNVTAGTVNRLGPLTIEAVRLPGDSTLAHLIGLIDQARRAKAPLQRTADRIAAALLPIVLLAAITAFAAWTFGRPQSIPAGVVAAVGVLVVACPVALGLAAPTAVVVAMGRAARAGILFRDGAALERLAAVDTVLFDKTGTLTEGRLKIVTVIPNVGETVDDVLATAAAAERGSSHPVGLAIVWEAARRGLPIVRAEDVEFVPGRGVRARVNGARIVVGQAALLVHSGVHRDLMTGEAAGQQMVGNAVIYVGRGNTCIGLVVVFDPIRANVNATIDALKAADLRLVVVTGDHERSARTVAAKAGIEDLLADTPPVEKYAVVQRLKNEGRVVAMCGDGTNDAPALAAADVGIALGTGTAAAIGVAGVALAGPDLRGVAFARQLSRATVRTIHRNLAVAFTYAVIAIPLAAGILVPLGGGLISPIWQAMGMAICSLLVVANSLRLGSARIIRVPTAQAV